MLKRIYINNFKCLVNFELTFAHLNLFLGVNGSGKTTVFQVLHNLQQFLRGDKKVTELFKWTELTRWLSDSPCQQFELDIASNEGLYKYSLEIEHFPEKRLARVKQESLLFNNQPLFRFQIEEAETGKTPIGMAYLYNDVPNHPGTSYPWDWSRSGLGGVQEGYENKKLSWFKKRLTQFFIVQVNPTLMGTESRQEETQPTWNLSNYVAWFDYLNQHQRRGVAKLEQTLRGIISGFDFFNFALAGEAKILKIDFLNESLNKLPTTYRFDELSEGQRTLIALYTLLYCVPVEECTLAIDEPENFLALPEIQPWLDKLKDQCEENHLQALLISHHPKLINLLASHSGYWFSRQGGEGHVRVQRICEEGSTGLPIAELVERGWIYEDEE